MLDEEDSLWCRILRCKYKGMVKQGDSQWWKDLNSIYLGSDQGRWFRNAVCKRLGDGGGTSFWNEDWTNSGVLKDRFPRLFRLSSCQEGFISEVGNWVDGSWVWSLGWSRELLEREVDSVSELLRSVCGFNPVRGQRDKWVWIKEGSGKYSVSSAYEILQGEQEGSELEALIFRKLWSAKTPSNSTALAWKVLLQRIQTKDELGKRRALPVGVGLDCYLCDGHGESCQHLFLGCKFSWKVWMRVLSWWGISTALPNNVQDLFIQFGMLGASCSSSAKIRTVIWIATVTAIWQTRNKVAFQGAVGEVEAIVDLIHFRSWLWLKSTIANFSYSMFEWVHNPWECISQL